jgi:hypothetical protein
MTTIYIAGPMTGLPDDNRPAFNKKAEELQIQGYRVLNPAAIGDLPYGAYWSINKAMLDGADIIYLLDGWEDSIGAKREFSYAIEKGVAVLFESGDSILKHASYKLFFKQVMGLPCCHDCGRSRDCGYRLSDIGDTVRINCPLWLSEKETKTCATCDYMAPKLNNDFGWEDDVCENAGSGRYYVRPGDTCMYWEEKEELI